MAAPGAGRPGAAPGTGTPGADAAAAAAAAPGTGRPGADAAAAAAAGNAGDGCLASTNCSWQVSRCAEKSDEL